MSPCYIQVHRSRVQVPKKWDSSITPLLTTMHHSQRQSFYTSFHASQSKKSLLQLNITYRLYSCPASVPRLLLVWRIMFSFQSSLVLWGLSYSESQAVKKQFVPMLHGNSLFIHAWLWLLPLLTDYIVHCIDIVCFSCPWAIRWWTHQRYW